MNGIGIGYNNFWKSLKINYYYLLSDNSSLFKLLNFGKFFSEVKPTFIRLKVSNDVKASVKPSIPVLLQLSKLSSVIYNDNKLN